VLQLNVSLTQETGRAWMGERTACGGQIRLVHGLCPALPATLMWGARPAGVASAGGPVGTRAASVPSPGLAR
jgi:hypothetical protein